MKFISIHNCAGHSYKCTYYYKGKIYTEEEWIKFNTRKEKQKEIVQITLFVVTMCIRAYTFIKYGI